MPRRGRSSCTLRTVPQTSTGSDDGAGALPIGHMRLRSSYSLGKYCSKSLIV